MIRKAKPSTGVQGDTSPAALAQLDSPPVASASRESPDLLGPPLRALMGKDEESKHYFENVAQFLGTVDGVDQLRTNIIGDGGDLATLADDVLSRLADRPEIHPLVRAWVESETLRLQWSHDHLVIVGAYYHRNSMIDGNAALTEDVRAEAHTKNREGADWAVALLRDAYIDFVIFLANRDWEDPAPKQPGRKRPGIKPPLHPLVLPNEPGYRALIYATTSGDPAAWDIGDERITLRTALTFERNHPLNVSLPHGGGGDALAAVIEILRAGEDGTALKTLLALPALFFDHNEHAKYNAVHDVTIADFMRYMGLKPNDGAFDREDQRRIWRAVQLLAKLWIPAIVSHSVKGKQLVTGQGSWYSPVVVLQGVQEGIHGIDPPQAFSYSLGKEFFSYYIGEQGQRTRMLQISPRIMEFHARRDLNPLRLAVYYASQFRIRKLGLRYGHTSFDVRYDTLLMQSGIPIDRKNPSRQFQRVQGWHNELSAKGIIKGWSSVSAPPPRSPFTNYAALKFTIERHEDEAK